MMQPLRLKAILVLCSFGFTAPAWADDPPGAALYKKSCASCHGAKGEGSDDFPHPLAGDRSQAELASYIARNMPKGAPKKCTPDEAVQVAAYIFDAFYSKDAQHRNRPPRVEASRLTVRQYRHTLADLIESFRTPGRWDSARGLKGEYYNAARFRTQNRSMERIDPVVQFEFGEAGPKPDPNLKPDPKKPVEFSIRWQGALLTLETGDYDFIVKTDNGVRLWVNDLQKPLIDAWVKSGSDTDHKGTIRLLGGRVYPLRLEYFKSKEPKATVALWWKPPRQTAELIPSRNLSPNRFPSSFVVTAPLPPDDRSVGYERGTSISRAWDQATTEGAIETADYIIRNLRELAPDAIEGRLREFCLKLAERAFARPLTDDQKKIFVERHFDNNRTPENAAKRALILILKSPRFLYRELGGSDSYSVASRLSFGLWDSLPDAELMKVAAANKLTSREEVARQAERMAADPRTRAKLVEFLHQWLKTDQVAELSKDRKRFPEFNDSIASDLRTSLDLFLDEILASPACDFRQLLVSDDLYLNGRLAAFYGAKLAADAPFQKVVFEPKERAGVLTHPFMMSQFAYTATTSPIHRGVFLARSVLGQGLRPPPEAFTPIPADLHPSLTTRERVALQTRPQACQSCHALINPLGYTLEHFDAVGRYRGKEEGKPIDTSGAYHTRGGQLVKFAGVEDLAQFLANSSEVHEAFVEQLFHYLVKQPIRAYGAKLPEELRGSFARNSFHIRKLVVKIMAYSALGPPHREAGNQPAPRPYLGD